MIIKTTLDQRGPITQEELEMLERLKNLPIVFDEDSPELTNEELSRLRPARVSLSANSFLLFLDG